MRETLSFDASGIVPARDAVLHFLGYPQGKPVSDRVLDCYTEAVERFRQHAEPVGLILELERGAVRTMIDEGGQCDRQAPILGIYTQAESLACFALTMGDHVSEDVGNLFGQVSYLLGYMLDAVASLATDRAVEVMEARYGTQVEQSHSCGGPIKVLGYSPGYCGWHVQGQRALFARLQPEEIGIHLNANCLMSPLKSVSGLLVAGRPGIHRFEDHFGFCKTCRSRVCRERMRR